MRSGGQQNVSGSMSGNNSDSGHPASPWLHQHAPANLHGELQGQISKHVSF